MRSIRHKLFKKCFEELSPALQASARLAFEKWKQDPSSVDWHHLSGTRAHFYAADIGYSARAVGLVTEDANGEATCVWIFIGTHEKYNNFINIQRQRSVESYLDNVSALKARPNSSENLTQSQPNFKQKMDIQTWRNQKTDSPPSTKKIQNKHHKNSKHFI